MSIHMAKYGTAKYGPQSADTDSELSHASV